MGLKGLLAKARGRGGVCRPAQRPATSPRWANSFEPRCARRWARSRILLAAADFDDTPSDGEVVPLTDTFVAAGSDSPYAGMKALVFGATGGCGKEIVKAAIMNGVPCSIFARSKAKAEEQFKDDIESSAAEGVFEGDVSRYEEVSKAVRASGANTIFIATGSRPALDPLGPFNVDYNGTANIVGAASASGKVDRIVLITSIGVDDLLFPLNLFFGVLFWKKRAEEVLQRSGITYTIVRPGGLLDQPRAGSTTVEPIAMGPADAYGLPPRKSPGSILRSQVAEVCLAAVVDEGAENKTVEIVTESGATTPLAELFSKI